MTIVKKARSNIKFKNRVFLFIKSVWALPVISLLALLLLSVSQISGSSIGVYQGYLNGDEKDSALLFGHPQGIRSDEWLVATQLTIAQESVDYQAINHNYSEPKNLGIITDAPTKEWPTLFKPQNIGFFLLPFQIAFAFKWWLLLFGLIVSAYVFLIRISKNNILLSVAGSIVISFAPFVFWWYQIGTIGPLVYGFIIATLCMSIIDNRQWRFFGKLIKQPYLNIAKSITLGYALSAFALILYPPFQIPVAIVIAFFVLGYLLNKRGLTKKPLWGRVIFTIVGSIMIAASVSLSFVATHSEEVGAITNTAYPGKREVSSGGFDIKTLLVNYLQPQLQSSSRGPNYIQNQSESSNFIVLPLFFILPAIGALILLFIKKRRVDWVLVCLLLCSLLFIAHLFLPLPLLITKLTFLYMVPQSRLLIGLGLLGIILAVYTALIFKNEFNKNKKLSLTIVAYSLLYFIVIVAAGLEITHLYPDFISSKKLVIGLAIIPTAGMWLLLSGKLKLGLGLLAVFSVASVFYVNPLYVGLGPIYKSEISQRIISLSNKDDVWATSGDILVENIPQMSGRKAITGVNPYPSMEFWNDYSLDKSIYNRYAHIMLSPNDTEALILVQPDLFAVSESCSRPVSQKIDYIISSSPLIGSCHKLIDSLKYPSRTFYFYKVLH